MKEKTVEDYMSEDIVKLKPSDKKDKFIEELKTTGHTGYPVCRDEFLVGYVTSKNILLSESNKISDVKYEKRPTISKDCSLNKASRIMSRNIIHELPVTNENHKLIGIISNLDIIRSQIERTQVEKVEKIISTYEKIYDVECQYKKQELDISDLKPTQSKIHRNELKAREHEIEKDTAEPIVVMDNKVDLTIIDGHHRAVACKNLGIEKIKAYVIQIDKKDINIQYNAESEDIYKVDDIRVKP